MKKNAEYEESDSDEEKGASEGVAESSSGEEESDDGAQQGGDSDSEREDDNGEDADDDDDDQPPSRQQGGSTSDEHCTFDMRNLVAVNSHQLDAASLYSSKKSKAQDDNITIPLTVDGIQVDETQLLKKAQDGCAQLISALWQLPTEKSDAGPLVTLPSYFEIKIPRALVSRMTIQHCLRIVNDDNTNMLDRVLNHNVLVASSTSKTGDEMGEIRERTRYWYQ